MSSRAARATKWDPVRKEERKGGREGGKEGRKMGEGRKKIFMFLD